MESLVSNVQFLTFEDLEEHCILSVPPTVAFSALSFDMNAGSLYTSLQLHSSLHWIVLTGVMGASYAERGQESGGEGCF